MDVDGFSGVTDQADESCVDCSACGVRTGGCDLYAGGAVREAEGFCRVVRAVVPDNYGRFGCGVVPVHDEAGLQACNRSAVEPQVCVAPVAERSFAEVLVTDVESADKSGFSVNNENLPVVAEVDAGVQERDFEREEDGNLTACCPEVGEELAFYFLYADRIEECPHLNACCGTFSQKVNDFTTEFVAPENVVFHVDVVLCGSDGLFECGELVFTMDIDVNCVVVRVGGVVLVEEKGHGTVEAFDLLRQRHIFFEDLLVLIPGNLGNAFIGSGLFAEDVFSIEVAAEEQVHYESYNRQKDQQKQPSGNHLRVSSFEKQQGDTGTNVHKKDEEDEEPGNSFGDEGQQDIKHALCSIICTEKYMFPAHVWISDGIILQTVL